MKHNGIYLQRIDRLKRYLEQPTVELASGFNPSPFYSVDMDPATPAKLHADITEIPLGNNSFNSVFSIDIIHHIKDKNKLYKEMHRLLKAGKYWVAYEPYNEGMAGIIRKFLHHEHFSSIRLSELLKHHNTYFKLVYALPVEHHFYPYQDNGGNQKCLANSHPLVAKIVPHIPTPFRWKIILVFQSIKKVSK